MGYKLLSKISGWTVFAIAFICYCLTAEPTGSLWDCGEFITGAYKFEVVHPPGAPIFLIIGRMFTLVADMLSDNPENIAYSINVMSGFFSALAAAFIAWTTIIFGKLALVGREGKTDAGQNIALAGAGLTAGLSTAFCVSIWFSAVEGEVYAMSTFFTMVVMWGMAKWYSLPDTRDADRWIVFSLFMAGMSIGVHLLSLLTFPALALLYYFKKYKEHNIVGILLSGVIGIAVMILIQYFVIIGVPTIWTKMEMVTVNSFGLPLHSGIVPTVLLFAGIIGGGLYYANKKSIHELQVGLVAMAMILTAFTSIGVVVIRASVNTPINMNDPSNAMRLLPYLNREQYGERPLLYGPHFNAKQTSSETEPRYDYVAETGKYEITDRKITPGYKPKKKGADSKHLLFPRISHSDRESLYMDWFDIEYLKDSKGQPRRDEEGHPILERQPTMSDNMYFFSRYQLGWMYWRYFMWNFSGKQNGKQGYNPWDKSKGHWITGINALDKGRTVDMTYATDEMKYDPARNAYFMLPFIFGLIGILWLFRKRPKDAFALLGLFLMTGIAIIIYSNQPPNEPRERDYVLIGSFAVFCIWIGMAVLAIYELLKTRVKLDGIVPGIIGTALVLIAPVLMGTQNWDDMSRSEHYGARDYASNFLNSVDKDAIIFTYGDNDTYPLWYAQEVEEIRTDVRVVNLSLIQVDWYIEQLRRKVNDSEAIKFTVSQAAIRGSKRSQFYPEDMVSRNPIMSKKRMALKDIVKFMGDDHPVGNANFRMESYVPTKKAYIALDSAKMVDNNIVPKYRASQVLPKMDFNLKSGRLLKGDLALLDIIASNVEDRPIYFAVTVRNENLQGLQNYLQMEGLALRLVPVKKGKNPEYGGYGTLGLGTLHTDKLYDNVMNKWQWGGFDKVDTHIDDKYGPSVQSMQIVFRRGIESLLAIDEKEKAVAMADKYFASFPNMNFAYDYSTFEFIEAYYKAGEPQKAKIHLDIYMTNAEQTLDFIDALDDNDVRASDTFQRDYVLNVRTLQDLYNMSIKNGDKELLEELKTRFERFDIFKIKPNPQDPG